MPTSFPSAASNAQLGHKQIVASVTLQQNARRIVMAGLVGGQLELTPNASRRPKVVLAQALLPASLVRADLSVWVRQSSLTA